LFQKIKKQVELIKDVSIGVVFATNFSEWVGICKKKTYGVESQTPTKEPDGEQQRISNLKIGSDIML
jgi:hypothetical protein